MLNFCQSLYLLHCTYSPTSIASNVFDSLWDFSTTFRRRRNLLFQFRLQIFRRRVKIFSHFFLCCFYFLLKVHVNFSSVFYRVVVWSSRHRPFCFHNGCYQKYATRVSVCVIAVRKSQEFLLKVRRLSLFFFDDDAYAFTSTRRNFLDDDARDSTSTTSRCFFDDVGH